MNWVPTISNDKEFYTNGEEFMFTNGINFIGYYYIINNNYYSIDNRKLIKYKKDPQFIEYIKLIGSFIYNKYESPIVIIPCPTQDDYKNGFIYRYFVKKRNDIHSNIIEINKKQYDLLPNKNKGIDNNLYFGISIIWFITGNINDTVINNITNIGIYNKNKKTIIEGTKSMYGLYNTITNYIEFYK